MSSSSSTSTPRCFNSGLPSEIINYETNTRIYDRNIPSQPLQAYLDVRPVMTKYSIMPIVDPRRKIQVPVVQTPTYNTHSTFNPGNTQSPWSGFNVNQESELRNQIYALQKCSQKEFVPSSKSDLYQWDFKSSKNIHQTHDLLFKEEKFCEFNPNSERLGYALFNNATRVQLNEFTNNEE